jgi:mycothiol system anti-sigma-R factor
MSCGDPHDTDCGEVLERVYEYLDGEMPEGDVGKIKHHLGECGPCLREFGIEDEIKKLIKRSCTDPAPIDLRDRVLAKLATARAAQRPVTR